MKYKKPICDCGNELTFREQRVLDVEYKITKKGLLFKKRKEVSEDFYGCDWLLCGECHKEYEYDIDKEGRYVRGEIR